MLCTICHINKLSGKQRKYCSRLCERKGWRDANHAWILADKKRYREQNRDKIRLYDQAYKAKVPAIKESLAMQLKRTFNCLRCESGERLEVHHIRHQRHGGGVNDQNNLLVLCKTCHARWHKFFDTNYWTL